MTPETTSFTRYKLTEPEEIHGSTLTSLNRAKLQNMRSEAAEQKLALVLDPYKPLEFIQQEAFLAGKIELVNILLQEDEAAQNYVAIQTPQQSNQGQGE